MRGSMLALIDMGEVYEAYPTYWAPFVVVGERAQHQRDGTASSDRARLL
jgi:hypothetical protein